MTTEKKVCHEGALARLWGEGFHQLDFTPNKGTEFRWPVFSDFITNKVVNSEIYSVVDKHPFDTEINCDYCLEKTRQDDDSRHIPRPRQLQLGPA